MKALKYLTMLLLVPLATSCAEDDLSGDVRRERLHEVELTFGFRLDSSVGSRGARPLVSADDWQKVTDMRIYVFRSNSGANDASFVYYHPQVRDERTNQISEQPYFYVPEFEKNSEDVWSESVFEEHTYRIVPMLGEGYYRFLAVGRDDNPDSTPLEINWTEGVTSWDKAVMMNNGGTPRVTEIFTGYPMNADGSVKTMQVTAESVRINEHITCRRSVAGVFLYVKDIPVRLTTEYAWHAGGSPTGAISQDVRKGVECTVDEVAIVAAGYNPDVDLVKRRYVENPETFITDRSRFFATRIASVNIDKAGLRNTDKDGYYETAKYDGSFVLPMHLFKRSFKADYEGGEIADAGNYTVFDKSLYLCLFHISGSGQYYPIKMIPIKIDRSIIHDYESEGICSGDNAISEDGFHYNLVSNHVYCLGYRNVKNGDEDPISLRDVINKSELRIEVIGNWQADVDIEM